jgi:DNA-binding transcriptional MerR regulator
VSSQLDEGAPDAIPGNDALGWERLKKAPYAYRTISEVADDLHVPQHVLRFWETRFPEVRPLKRGGGRRYYRPEDIDVLRRISELLYVQGYTIKGVQRVLREGEGGTVVFPEPPNVTEPSESETDLIGAEAEDSLAIPAAPESAPVAESVSSFDAEALPDPVVDMSLQADLDQLRREADVLRSERQVLRHQLRDILEELCAIRNTLPH